MPFTASINGFTKLDSYYCVYNQYTYFPTPSPKTWWAELHVVLPPPPLPPPPPPPPPPLPLPPPPPPLPPPPPPPPRWSRVVSECTLSVPTEHIAMLSCSYYVITAVLHIKLYKKAQKDFWLGCPNFFYCAETSERFCPGVVIISWTDGRDTLSRNDTCRQHVQQV